MSLMPFMPDVELVYDADCPNPALARSQLLRAFARAGRVARWREWLTDDADAPPHVRGYGSPTVLVDGRDVAGAVPVEGMRSCRVYAGPADQPRGAPSVELIVAALLRSEAAHPGRARRRPRRFTAAMAPALGISLAAPSRRAACPGQHGHRFAG